MNLLDYFEFFFLFLTNDFFDGLYAALIGFAVLGVILGLFGRRRYCHV